MVELSGELDQLFPALDVLPHLVEVDAIALDCAMKTGPVRLTCCVAFSNVAGP